MMPSPMNAISEGGIHIAASTIIAADAAHTQFQEYARQLGVQEYIAETRIEAGATLALTPTDALRERALQDGGTIGLANALGLDTQDEADLDREILLSMLACPVPFVFPNHEELLSAVRIRRRIVQGARRTALAFDTEAAERPAGYWTYDTERGFTVLPGKSLITALQLATQPEEGRLYAFSCYRATEYVTVLGIAQELEQVNPEQYGRLQQQWETRAVMSGRFHEVFLREYGSLDDPLPPGYYVPGDRLWFRNPDSHSSNIEGYEGSWVFYLGSGLFNNFWKRDQPYTLTAKCVEIYHWRHGARTDASGKLAMDESVVEARSAVTLADPDETARVLDRMLRIRDPQGVYEEGGCIDATRECARWVRPGTSDIVLPDFPA
ncbi:lipoprotein [Bordetella ansorpii]|uniref:Lipoprotein n=2 Tax=Bordetella ansorpii TaxID=288768 RepID=A0A157RAI1_9BORD|nr:lipoprotein [Bordetella ansorpii]